MAGNKTGPTGQPVGEFLGQVTPERRRLDALVLDHLFRRATGFEPQMWGPSIIGYGRYHYRYDSGRGGDFLATGFAPRKASMVLYIMPGYADFGPILSRIGKHKAGKSCLYVNRLSDVDEAALEELIRAGLQRLNETWPVLPA